MSREIRLHTHSQFVLAWIKRALPGLAKRELILEFEKAFNRLLLTSKTSISEITLTAVLDRILDNSTEAHPLMSVVHIEEAHLVFEDLQAEASNYDEEEIKKAFHFLITEFLFVIGNLTGEQLTPILHAELDKKENI